MNRANPQLSLYATALRYVRAVAHGRALSQGFEPGHDPYNSATVLRGIDFGQTRAEWHADEAFFSIADEEIRRAAGIDPYKRPCVRQASYSAIAVENDRATFGEPDAWRVP